MREDAGLRLANVRGSEKEGGQSDANAFLLGCFMPNDSGRFMHRVPCIMEDGDKCHRSFTLCAKQFMQLFDLTESQFQQLWAMKRNTGGDSP